MPSTLPVSSDSRYEHNMARVRADADAKHWLNSPGHGAATLREIAGIATKVLRDLDDDPALAACQIYDILPELYGHLHALNTWAYAVRMADPGSIPDHGARDPL